MLSLKSGSDTVSEARATIRSHRMALSWRQEDLAKRSGVAVATVRRFERSGRIGFVGLAKLLVALGLADRFLDARKPPRDSPKSIAEFLAAAPSQGRKRAPRKAKSDKI